MAFKIYTKTGDMGKTSLIGGKKVYKSHIRIESYGTVDELNSYVGLIKDMVEDQQSKEILKEIQDRLFTIGSALACDPKKATGMHLPDLKNEDVSLLEREIDNMQAVLAEMKSFILPGGHVIISSIHISRCVCRRAERICVHLQQEEKAEIPLIIIYLNRLSDYLFTLARFQGKLLGIPDVPWKARV